MKLLFSWLKEFVELSSTVTAQELAECLEGVGIEINEVRAPGAGIKNVVIGKLIEITSHPNADRLVLCKTDIGDKTIQVVTAATNVSAGDTIAVALDGALLATGLKIKKGKLRGEVSEGMLCSTEELGLLPSPEGVWVLGSEFTVGQDAVIALGLDDPVIDYEVPPNRGDLYGVLGVAREVAASYRVPLTIPEIKYDEAEEEVQDSVKIRIEAPDLCPRYTGTVIRGVDAARRSPFWLERRLLMCGQRPLGVAVDITNYVLLEWGHPLHAFDLSELAGGEILVRRAEAGEKAVTLDEVERELGPEMLVIADRDRTVAVAGVMGCLGSGVTAATKDILLESAYFLPSSIRLTARALKHSTAASQIFERGSDYLGLSLALRRATGLLGKCGGGSISRGVYDVLPQPFARKELKLRTSRLGELLGTVIEDTNVQSILEGLGCECEPTEPGCFTVVVPSWRGDISREEDLVEEVARHHGYDQIAVLYPEISPRTINLSGREQQRRLREDLLVARGYQQIISYSFQALKKNLPERPEPVALRHPLSPEMAVLRADLLPGLLSALRWNRSYQTAPAFRFFEVGRVFRCDPQGGLPYEEERLGLLLAGCSYDWRGGSKPDFYTLKSTIEAFLKLNGLTPVFADRVSPFLMSGQAATITAGTAELGWLGQVDPELAETYDIKEPVLAAELSMVAGGEGYVPQYQSISRHPVVERDLALIVKHDITAETLTAHFRQTDEDWLEQVTLFDLYQGPPLADDEKSLGYRLLFRASETTLTDEQVNGVMERIVQRLEKQCGARLRR